MGSKIEYVDSTQIYATSYVRNAKAIGVLWVIFTICYGIIGMVTFVTPEWIGNSSGDNPGKFGLWSTCRVNEGESGEQCRGHLSEFTSMENIAFQGATVAVGLAVLTALLTVCAMCLFFFCHSTTVYYICAWLQLFSAICMISGCVTYPVGWSSAAVQHICGPQPTAIYSSAACSIRWAYILAAILSWDAIILATLAFILATRHIRLQPDPQYASTSAFKGEMNSGFVNDSASMTGSRKSLNLHPVLMMHPGQEDTYSQFSQRTVPRAGSRYGPHGGPGHMHLHHHQLSQPHHNY